MKVFIINSYQQSICHMNEQRSFKKDGTFNLEGQEYLYQLHADGNNSLLRLYNSRAKLRSTQRIKLPANYAIYTCQQYLILLNPTQIILYQIPSMSTKSRKQNPGLKSIVHCKYNFSANLIFIIDQSNQLWYIMPQVGTLTVKRLLNQKDNIIKQRVTQLAVDNKSVVHLLCEQNHVLHSLKFEWNKNDKLNHHDIQKNVAAIYCRFGWKIIIELIEDDPQNYKLRINDSEFVNTVSKFGQDYPIIKATRQDFVYLDLSSKNIVIINKGEQIRFNDFNTLVSPRVRSNNFLFEIKNTKYNTITLSLHFFEGLREPFFNVDIPIKWLDIQKEEEIFVYIHNNIHLIIKEDGLCPHFTGKVRQYMSQQPEYSTKNLQDMEDEKLCCIFLQKLFKKAPLTVQKLAHHLIKQKNSTYLAFGLSRFLTYLNYSLEGIVENLIELKNRNHGSFEQIQQQVRAKYELLRQQLKNIIGFIAKIHFAVSQQQAQANIPQSTMNEENGAQNIKYSRCLQRSKVLYLLNQITYEYLCNFEPVEKISMVIGSQISEGSQIRQEDSVYSFSKFGVEACHQLFDQSLQSNLSFKGIFDYLLKAEDFLQAAYLYIYMDSLKISIPYISDSETVQLIRFLVASPVKKVLANREQLRSVLKALPKITGQALLINQSQFLQYLCGLSIDCQQYKCCLAIVLSGVTMNWPIKTRDFVIECLIECDKILLAYDQLVRMSHSEEERHRMLQKFVNFCIKSRKVKDLFHLGYNSMDENYFKERLRLTFGDDVQEIASLMKQLQKHSP